jgi:adenylate cyclase
LLVAARIAGMAESDQILVTSLVIDELPPHTGIISRRMPEMGLAEQDGTHLDLAAIGWQSHEHAGEPPDPMVGTAAKQSTANTDSLAIHYRGKTFLVNATSPCLTIGRDAENQLVIADRKASRAHGLIEHRGGSYFYVDRSTNGSHVRMAGQGEVPVRRQEIKLSGSGRILFGGPGNDPKTEFAEFAHL